VNISSIPSNVNTNSIIETLKNGPTPTSNNRNSISITHWTELPAVLRSISTKVEVQLNIALESATDTTMMDIEEYVIHFRSLYESPAKTAPWQSILSDIVNFSCIQLQCRDRYLQYSLPNEGIFSNW
jgi:hypothetical protein